MKLDYERIALVLQGGGALGAYQAGVYQGLHEAGIAPNWVAGISIGAINAALIAGNPPRSRLERLQEFWETISRPAWPDIPGELGTQVLGAAHGPARGLANLVSATRSMFLGQSGFFAPRPLSPWFHPPGGERATSFYDTGLLRGTLERLVDFDLLNNGAVRLSVGAVNVASGNLRYFDSVELTTQGGQLGPQHIMASGALPPAFPAVEIDGEYYWDGGIVSNTPLEYVLEYPPRRDTLAFQMDLWGARGEVPDNMVDVLERHKDIQFSSRTRRGTDQAGQRQGLRRAIARALAHIPPELRADPVLRELERHACSASFNVIQLIYRSKWYENHYKDYEFSPATMRAHWQAGLKDIRDTLADLRRLARPQAAMATHDVHRGT